jgi:site-specific recombinase XerD
MKGIDLNTVRELMGHSDLKMTLRYARLAPKSKPRAAEVLAKI